MAQQRQRQVNVLVLVGRQQPEIARVVIEVPHGRLLRVERVLQPLPSLHTHTHTAPLHSQMTHQHIRRYACVKRDLVQRQKRPTNTDLHTFLPASIGALAPPSPHIPVHSLPTHANTSSLSEYFFPRAMNSTPYPYSGSGFGGTYPSQPAQLLTQMPQPSTPVYQVRACTLSRH